MVVYKYRVPFPSGDLNLPLGVRVLSLQMQHSFPTLWALVDPDQPKVSCPVRALATGHTMPGPVGAYLGTVQFDDGTVWHYFFPGQRPAFIEGRR